MICSVCYAVLERSALRCHSCQTVCELPNVRMASEPIEQRTLDNRYNFAVSDLSARGLDPVRISLESEIAAAKVIITRSFIDVASLASDENRSYVSHAKQLLAGIRRPSGNHFDDIRSQFENAVFPNFASEIIFGSLSISERGLSNYGGANIVMREASIKDRSTVFEKNPAYLARDLNLTLNDVFPPGHRATWRDRAKLVIAKLFPVLTSGMSRNDFDALLQADNGGGDKDEFIEVHVYGSIDAHSFEKVVATPSNPNESLLWQYIQNMFASTGIATVTR